MDKVLCLDIGGSSIKSGLCSIDGTITNEEKHILENRDYVCFLDTIKKIISNTHDNIKGISLALPGGYDILEDSIFAPNLLFLNGQHIKKDITSLCGIDVLAENDANLAAYGEYVFGDKKSVQNMVFCTLGTGFGGGLILNGRLLQSNITLFEIGHLSVDFNGRKCGCGRKGCLDEYCSTSGLLEIYKEVSGDNSNISTYDLKTKADNNNEYAINTFKEYGKLLANAFANITALLCPEKIKFGGGLSELSEYYMESLLNEYNNIVFPTYKSRVKIERAVLKNQAGMLGGAALHFGL